MEDFYLQNMRSVSALENLSREFGYISKSMMYNDHKERHQSQYEWEDGQPKV